MTHQSITRREGDYGVRVFEWREARDAGNKLFWPLFWLSVPLIIAARILQDHAPWSWYLAAAPMLVAFSLYGLYRRRLNRLAKELGLICWNCGNNAVESSNYLVIRDPEGVVRDARCLWCFRKVDEGDGRRPLDGIRYRRLD